MTMSFEAAGRVAADWLAHQMFRWAVAELRNPWLAKRVLAAAQKGGECPTPAVLAGLFELEEELRWGATRRAWVAAVLRARQ